MMSEIYKPGEPGAAVIVRRDGRTIFRKGYGLADLELGVKVEPDMIFRLGSITKQFTAVGHPDAGRTGQAFPAGRDRQLFPRVPDRRTGKSPSSTC